MKRRMRFPLVTNQIEFSALHLSPANDGTLDYLQQRHVTPMIWSPLAGTALLNEDGDKPHAVRAVMSDIMEQTGAETIAQVALSFIRRHPSNPIPVLGSMKLDRVRSMTAAARIKLDRQQWFSIWQAGMRTEVP